MSTSDSEFLQQRVPEYHGFGDEDDRHDSDLRVRAYVGEILSLVREKNAAALSESVNALLDLLIFRCQFSDQRHVRALEHADLNAEQTALLEHLDRTVIEAADRIKTAPPAEIERGVDELTALFDRRDAPFGAPTADQQSARF